jgi:hypothetical protein
VEITIVNLHVPSVGAPNFIKDTLLNLKTQIDPNTVILLCHQYIGHTGKKNQQKTLELNDTVDQWTRQMSTEYSILQQHNIHSSQQPMEFSPKYIIC